MTQAQLSRSKLGQICSLQAYEWLQELIIQWHPNQPYPLTPKQSFYKNTSHRQYLSKYIEAVIVKTLRKVGGDPINSVDSGQLITDARGNKKYVFNAKVKKGRADVKCFIFGKMVNFEVKVGKDRMSDYQHEEKARAEANGEVYLIIRSIDDFMEWYKKYA